MKQAIFLKIYRSRGRIHIGDQILAFNQHFLSPLPLTGKPQTNPASPISSTQHVDICNQCVSKINSSCNNINDYQLSEKKSSNVGKIRKEQREELKSLNYLKFTEKASTNTTTTTTAIITGKKSGKEREREERSTTASDLVLTQTDNCDNDDDDDDDDREVPKKDEIWKFDSENVTAVFSPSSSIQSTTTLIDRYEKLIENFNDHKNFVYDNNESKNSTSIIVVTLLRQSPHMVLTSDWTEVQIIHLPNIPGIGLGFGIVGGTSSGVVVKTILPGSVADKDKRLRPGDHILRIRGINVHGMSPQQIATLLRRQDTLIELVVGRPALASDSCKDTKG
ncbi:PDZ domain (Also known as DHR or GLGF) family protein [Acanthocheilonema viteae]